MAFEKRTKKILYFLLSLVKVKEKKRKEQNYAANDFQQKCS